MRSASSRSSRAILALRSPSSRALRIASEFSRRSASSRAIRAAAAAAVLLSSSSSSSSLSFSSTTFLDLDFIAFYLSIPANYRYETNKKQEKYLFRKAFDRDYLPDSVLWRRKDGMSDGVSGLDKKWYEHIREYVDTIISDEEYEPYQNQFPSKEAYYYKKLYDQQFPTYQPSYEYWLPKWVEHNGDPSGRILTIFNK